MKNKIILLAGILFIFCIYFGPTLIIKNNQTFHSDKIHTFDMLNMPKPIMEPTNIVLIRDAVMANNYYILREKEVFEIVKIDDDKFLNEINRLQEFDVISKSFQTSIASNKDKFAKVIGGGSVYLYEVKVKHKIYEMYQISTQNKFINLSLPKEHTSYTDEKKKTLLQNYIKYLGLDYITDWSYKNGSLFSSKVHGAVRFQEKKDNIVLQLVEQYHES